MQLIEIIEGAINNQILRKTVFSKPSDKKTIRAAAKPYSKNGVPMMQLETQMKDGKALHENIPAAQAAERLCALFMSGYHQLDIITTAGDCVAMRSDAGRFHIKNNIKEAEAAEKIVPESHDRQKNYILDGSELFLRELDISDSDGHVIDRRRAKFRQINRFLEILRDTMQELPENGTLTVCDLCCGKSYLTFAVYHYLTEICGRNVEMYGLDRKDDVIEYCCATAGRLGYGGMHFSCMDVMNFTPQTKPDLMISLHACDTATDIVLACAVKNGAGVILSTPCCHHEMSEQLDCAELEFIARYPILKQKLCDAATDALRALRLEAEGYDVTALELIDPEETPKNVMLRAVYVGKSENERSDKLEKYREMCVYLGASPYLTKLLDV